MSMSTTSSSEKRGPGEKSTHSWRKKASCSSTSRARPKGRRDFISVEPLYDAKHLDLRGPTISHDPAKSGPVMWQNSRKWLARSRRGAPPICRECFLTEKIRAREQRQELRSWP